VTHLRPIEDLITTEEFAALARTSASTVRYWRHVGRGPRGFKVGRRVLYERQAVLDWLEELRAAEAS